MISTLIRQYVRSILLSEEIGRSYHTPNSDPSNWMEQEGVRVITYFDHLEDEWHIIIEKLDEKTGEWEDIDDKTFKHQSEAQFWANQQIDVYQRKKFAGDPELTGND